MDGIWSEYEEAAVKQMMQYTFIGSAEQFTKNWRLF
jgi:hypothetical protein